MARIDIRHPFFNPRWRRVATVLACFGWAGLEAALGNPGWAAFFAAIGAYCTYEFFVIWTDQDDGKPKGPE